MHACLSGPSSATTFLGQLWKLDRVFLSVDLSDPHSANNGLWPARIVYNRCIPSCFMWTSGERDPEQRETFPNISEEKPACGTIRQPHPAARGPLASFLYPRLMEPRYGDTGNLLLLFSI